ILRYIHLNLGKILIEKEEFKYASDNLNTALRISNKIGNSDLKMKVYLTLSSLKLFIISAIENFKLCVKIKIY
ncbi:MAG: hypothetical protein N2323_07775, partial [candidate division WOR-3 bacterium]|nr:hypothetical protein [candidate division WOR-3 bacterium]